MAFAPGTRLGFYEVPAKIREGGMGRCIGRADRRRRGAILRTVT